MRVSWPIFDDSYISLTFARNVADHGMLSFDGQHWSTGATSTVFVMPAFTLGGIQVAPSQVMQQSTRTAVISPLSATVNEGWTCTSSVNYPTGEYIAVDVIGAFPFVGPYRVR